MAQDHKMNVRRCDQCQLDTNVNALDFCMRCQQTKCLTHYTKMNSICDQCYDPQDNKNYAVCYKCNYMEHVDLMFVYDMHWKCRQCRHRCDSCRSTIDVELYYTIRPYCYGCECRIQFDILCKKCMGSWKDYIYCAKCGYSYCITCVDGHNCNRKNLQCERCDKVTNDSFHCIRCNKTINLCRSCIDGDRCRDCSRCAYCPNNAVSQCANDELRICLDHSVKFNGKFYCGESCIPCCQSCKQTINVNTKCKRHRN